MEYHFSTIIEPCSYQTESLCDGIDLRMHKYTAYEDRGAIRAHQDWSKYISPLKEYRGTLGPKYSFMTMTVPECIPERLEIISYANEFAFLHDDVTDNVAMDVGERENDNMMNAFREGAQNGYINSSGQNSASDGKKLIQGQLLKEMMEIDRECAITTMKSWAKFVEVGSSRNHETVFTRLEDYFPYRIMDVGEMFWYGVVTFGMGIQIPEHELPKCRELLKSAWIAVGLQNDLWSWPKEYEAAKKNGQSHVINALWVIMQENNCDLEAAQQTCRQLIKGYVHDYRTVVENNKNNQALSIDLRKYVEAMQYSISGNVIWSLTCPRYNPQSNFNLKQLEWMNNGVPGLEECFPDKNHMNKNGTTNGHTEKSHTLTNGVLENGESMSVATQVLPSLCHKLIKAPFEYVDSLPSKQIRGFYIDALNIWLGTPAPSVCILKEVTRLLHNSSLLLDDFQDATPLRRGKPAAHTIFGAPQAVDSASYSLILAISRIMHHSDIVFSENFAAKIMQMFVGQTYDLYWTRTLQVPSVSEYLQMIDSSTSALFSSCEQANPWLPSETGTLFQLIAEFLSHHATANRHVDFTRFNMLLGRFFQIRDDLLNLTSADGFCDDLDEGKFSLPMIHLLSSKNYEFEIKNILATRAQSQSLSVEQKRLVLDRMKASGSLAYTRDMLGQLYAELWRELEHLETDCKQDNGDLGTILSSLKF